GLTTQARILEDQYAPFGFLGSDEGSGLEHGGPDLVEAPDGWQTRALGFGRYQGVHDRPQRRHILLVDASIEGRAFGGLERCVFHGTGPCCSPTAKCLILSLGSQGSLVQPLPYRG